MNRTIAVSVLICAILSFLAVSVVASAPVPDQFIRYDGQAAWANGKIHWIGGESDWRMDGSGQYFGGDSAGQSVYDPDADAWTSSKYDRTGPKGVDLNCDGHIFGNVGLHSPSQLDTGIGNMSCQVFVCDPDNDGTQEILIHGGSGSACDGSFMCYDPATDVWTKIGAFSGWPGVPSGTDSGTNQTNGIAVAYGDSAYCYGGLDWGYYPDDDYAAFAKYSFANGQWTPLPRGPVSIVDGVGAVIGDALYIAGGMQLLPGGAWSSYSTDIWRYDFLSQTWSSSPVGHLEEGVQRASVCVHEGRMYVIGGYKMFDGATDGSNAIQEFDPGTGNTSIVAVTPTEIRGGGAAISPAGVLYVGGGLQGPDYTPSTDWWKADISNYTFSQIANDPACFPYEDWLEGSSIGGQVLGPNSLPVENAVVGLKTSSKATADAIRYTTTDSNGCYYFGSLIPGMYYVAASKESFFAPCIDSTVSLTDGTDCIANLVLANFEGIDVATDKPTLASSSDETSYFVTDGNLLSQWSTDQQPTAPQYIYIDLRNGQAGQAINGITLYWASGRPSDYQVDTLTAGGNPLLPESWDCGATVTRQYSASGAYNGYPTENGGTMCPIRFDAPVTASGLRIKMNEWYGWAPYYGICEVKVHSSTAFTQSILQGTVKDDSGNPIYNAVVQLDGTEGPAVVTDPSGSYSFITGSGNHYIMSDAPGYASKTIQATVGNKGLTNLDLTLASRDEQKVFNAGFEMAGSDDSQASGWEIKVDGPYSTSQYVGMRSTRYNATPGGCYCGWLHTAVPLDPPFIGSEGNTHYWTEGWISPIASKQVPVTPTHRYNFYFKARGGDIPSYLHWSLVWLRADRTPIDGSTIDIMDFQVPLPGDWTQILEGAFQEDGWARHKMIRMAPPADAAYADIRIGLLSHPYDDPNKEAELFFDDVVFDEAPPASFMGRVTDTNGNPIQGAVVGLKSQPKAVADADQYTTTDATGRYSFSCPCGNYYLAAWTEGKSPSQDLSIIADGNVTVPDIQLDWDGVNVVAAHPERTAASNSVEGSPGSAVDESLDTSWATDWYVGQAYYYIDLGKPTNIKDISTYRLWTTDPTCTYKDDMTIDVMTGSNPLDPNSWTDIGTNGVSTVYYAAGSIHGFVRQPGTVVDRIRLDLTGITGIRLGFSNYQWPPNFDLKEVQVHNDQIHKPITITGKVLDSYNFPIYGAIVGVKKSAKATCDTETYVLTDANGNYSFPAYTADQYYVAAWKDGYYPTDDKIVSFSDASGIVPNLSLATNTSENLLLHKGDQVAASGGTPNSVSLATDGQLIDYCGTYGWVSDWDGPTPQYYYVDLQQPTDISCILMYRFLERNDKGDSRDDYEISTMTSGNPLDPTSWSNPASGVTHIYNAYGTIHGYEIQPGLALNAMHLNLTGIRGLRFKFDTPHWPLYFDMKELQVYGTPRTPVTFTGHVLNLVGNPVAGATVGFKKTPIATADAESYVVTDSMGYYSFSGWSNTKYYVAAWKQGMCPSADQQVTSNGNQVDIPELQLIDTGDNMMLKRPERVSASDQGTGAASMAVDGNIYGTYSTGWCTSDWVHLEDWYYYYVNVSDTPVPVKDITIYRWLDINNLGTSEDDYQVEVMTSGTGNPLSAAAWNDSSNGISTIYSAYSTLHGYSVGSNIVVDPIPVNVPAIRGIRIKFRNAHWPRQYEIHEIEVHAPPDRLVVNTVGQAKLAPIGSKVSISDKQLTAIPSNIGVPAGVAYVEELDRSAGIRLNVSGVDMANIFVGDRINIDGQVDNTSSGEKCLVVTNLTMAEMDNDLIDAVGVNGRTAKTQSILGMFVRIWGYRTTATSGINDYYLDDGSGIPIHCYCSGGTTPALGQLVSVTGILSLENNNPVLYLTDTRIRHL